MHIPMRIKFPFHAIASFLVLFSSLSLCGQSGKPVITKIDPPNWFTGLPNSLLLVHGEHLENTSFAIRNSSAQITETTISANGHWAFLGIQTNSAKPGQLDLIATNSHGSASSTYTLSTLRQVTDQPKGFGPSDVIYLIMPDRFADGDASNNTVAGFHAPDDRGAARSYHGGDLRGIQEHLDYLQQLGVTTIWTTPLYDNSAGQTGETYHGYSATNMYAVDPHFGTMSDLQALVKAAHARGMKVILDTVPNHVGPAHPWANDPPTPDWLHGSPSSHLKTQFDFNSIVNPNGSATTRSAVLNGWFADILPDLNQDNPLVATYLIQNSIWWIESAGLDGLRIDTFPFVPRSFWHNFNLISHTLYPHMTDVGEIFHEDPHVTSFFAGGKANKGSDGTYDTLLDTPFDYPLFFALRSTLTHQKPMTAVADVLQQDSLYPHPERLVTFIGNHDNKRFLSETGATPAGLHLAFGLLATLRGTPQLYYGDEIEMKGGDDPDNRKDFPGGFSQDKTNAFEASQRSEPQEVMHKWVETLLQLRATTPALQTGHQTILLSDSKTLAFMRSTDETNNCLKDPAASRYLIIVNNDIAKQTVSVPLPVSSLAGCSQFTPMLNTGVSGQVASGKLQIQLPGQEIGIFRIQP
jgi:glycosidase